MLDAAEHHRIVLIIGEHLIRVRHITSATSKDSTNERVAHFA